MVQFSKGMTKIGGRQRGVRNRLSHAFLSDLLEEWSEHGKETLRIARVEEPVAFAKMVAALLPSQFELEVNSSLTEVSDSDLESFIEYCRSRIAAGGDARFVDGRADPAPDSEPARLLPAAPEAT
jgi:hypothetical protein